MQRLISAVMFLWTISSVGVAGETKITKVTKNALPMDAIEVVVEGTNELFDKQVLESWGPAFIRPECTDAAATIVSYTAPVAGGGPAAFKIKRIIKQ